jgi:hypothetical protein
MEKFSLFEIQTNCLVCTYFKWLVPFENLTGIQMVLTTEIKNRTESFLVVRVSGIWMITEAGKIFHNSYLELSQQIFSIFRTKHKWDPYESLIFNRVVNGAKNLNQLMYVLLMAI